MTAVAEVRAGAVDEDAPTRPARWSWVRGHPLLTVLGAGVVVATYNVVWISRHRLQGGFDGDEAGYLATAIRFRTILGTDGVNGLLHAAISNFRSGPLTPLLSAPFVLGSHPITSAMVVQPLLHLVAAVAVAAVARHLAGSVPALVAGAIALGLPGAIQSARSYQPVPAVTATLALAVLALVASDRGRRTWCLVLFGVATGAMLTSRSMTIAFLPGLGLAALLVIERTRRSILGLLGAGLAVVAVAGPWWIHEWSRSIEPYLFRYGYGQGSEDLGPSSPVLRVLVRLGLVMVDVRPLLAVPAAIACVLVARRVVPTVRGRDDVLSFVERHRDLLAVWTVVVVGWLCLLSSSNIGTWFQLPLEVVALPAIVGSVARIRGRAPARLARWAVAVSVCNIVLISNWQIGSTVPIGAASFSVDAFGGVEISQAIDFAAGDPRFAPPRSTAAREEAMREWGRAANRVARAVAELTPPGGSVMQTFVGDIRLFQATTLELAERVTGLGTSPWEAPSARSTTGDGSVSLEPYGSGRPRVIVAVLAGRRDRQEGFAPDEVLARAHRLGWVVKRRIALPDGGEVELLTHPDSSGP